MIPKVLLKSVFGLTFLLLLIAPAFSQPMETSANSGIRELLKNIEYWINYVGSTASIISLGLTVWILMTISRIRNQYLFRGRIPDLLKALEENASELNSNLLSPSVFDNNRLVVQLTLSKAEAILNHIKRKVKGSSRKNTKRLIKQISKVKRRIANASHSDVFIIYAEVRSLAIDLGNKLEDVRWGGQE